jgi:hypothetical protein
MRIFTGKMRKLCFEKWEARRFDGGSERMVDSPSMKTKICEKYPVCTIVSTQKSTLYSEFRHGGMFRAIASCDVYILEVES